MPEENPQDQSAEENSSQEDRGESDSQEYVSMAEFKALGDSLVKSIDEASKRNRQSQADVIKHEVGERMDTALKGLSDSFQPADPQQETEQEQESQSQDDATSAPQKSSVIESEIEGLITEFGLKGDEQELADYSKEHEGEPWFQAGPGFAALAEELGARSDGAIQAGLGAGAAPRPDLVNEYAGKVRELRERVNKGELRGYASGIALSALKEEYRSQGVGVDTMIFGLDGTLIGEQQQEDLRPKY